MSMSTAIAALVDSTVGIFAARRALERRAARAASEQFGASFRGARQNRLQQGWAVSSGSADYDLLPDLAILRERSRELLRNDPHAASVVGSLGDKSVTEIRLRQSYPKGRKKSGNQQLKPEDFHTDWATAVCWGLTSDIAQQLEVDDFIIVEGRWHHEEWTDKKSGDKRQRDVIMTTYLHRETRTFGDVTPSIKTSQEEEAFPF